MRKLVTGALMTLMLSAPVLSAAPAMAITPGTGCGTATGSRLSTASAQSTLQQEVSPAGTCYSRVVIRCSNGTQYFGSWKKLNISSVKTCPSGTFIATKNGVAFADWGWQVGS